MNPTEITARIETLTKLLEVSNAQNRHTLATAAQDSLVETLKLTGAKPASK